MLMWPAQQLFRLLRFLSWENFIVFFHVFSSSLLLYELHHLFLFVPLLPSKRFAEFFPFSFTSFLAPCWPASPRLLLSSPNGFVLQPVNSCSEFSTDNFLRIKSLSIIWHDFFFKLKFISRNVLINKKQNGSFHLWCTKQIILVKPIQSHWF